MEANIWSMPYETLLIWLEWENNALLMKLVDDIDIGELTAWVPGSGPKNIWETVDQEAT